MLLRPPPAPQYVTANQNPVGGYNNQPDPLPDIDDDSDDGDSHDVSTSDFIIMQSSFECKLFHDPFYVTSVLDACKLHWDYLLIRFNGRFWNHVAKTMLDTIIVITSIVLATL